MFFCATSVHWRADFQLHDNSFLELCAPRFLLFYKICFLFFSDVYAELDEPHPCCLENDVGRLSLITSLLNKLSELSRRMFRTMVDGNRDPSIWIILMNVADFAVQDFRETSRKCTNHCSNLPGLTGTLRMHVCRFQPQIWELRKFLFLAWGYSFALPSTIVAATSKYRISGSLDSKMLLLLIRNFIFELRVLIQRSLWICCRKNPPKDKYMDFHLSQCCGRQVIHFLQQHARLVTILTLQLLQNPPIHKKAQKKY